MAHFNEIVVKTAKNKKNTQKAVKASLAEVYPGYQIQELIADNGDWKATLLKQLTSAEAIKLAEFPFEMEEVEEGGEMPEKEEHGETTSSPASDDGEEPEEKNDSEDGKTNSTGTELKDIESLLLDLMDQVTKLQEKAGLVDEIHESTKPLIDAKKEIPGGPLGMGGPGEGAPGPAGPPTPPGPKMPTAKIAYAAIKQDDFEFSMAEVVDAMQEKYANYTVVDVKKDIKNNRYVAKLELK